MRQSLESHQKKVYIWKDATRSLANAVTAARCQLFEFMSKGEIAN